NMIKKDVRTFMQKVMPANQNSRAYQTSSMITTGALDGIALGSAAAAGYQFINKAASFSNNALTAMKNIRLQPTNVSTAEIFPTNRIYSGLDIKQMLKSVKQNTPIGLSQHAKSRMIERGIKHSDVLSVIQKNKPIKYYHAGTWKRGFYDKKSKIFVAESIKENSIITVINNVKPKYIKNLMRNKP
ncbi:MAG: hypothetical protein K1000chlam1_01474, partial [Candidatus Anoxychlamydiales bacterium]|nr:hypothetical protein [Candidatus Anoxychlamydiales bacterium]